MSGSPPARQGTLSGDGGFPVCCSTRTSSHSSSRPLPTAASRQSDNASRSHSTSHPYTSCPGSPCTVSTCRRVCPGAVASSTSLQFPSLCCPTAYSSSMAVSDLLSRRRISGSGCDYITLNVPSGAFSNYHFRYGRFRFGKVIIFFIFSFSLSLLSYE